MARLVRYGKCSFNGYDAAVIGKKLQSMSASDRVLEEIVRIVPSGYRHPYFAVRREKPSVDSMLARITTWPSLGRWNVIQSSEEVHFTVLVETNASNVKSWYLEVWWGQEGTEWSSLPLSEVEQPSGGVLSPAPSDTRPYWYKASMPVPKGPCQFTVKFKTSQNGQWKWARDLSGVEDGRILVQSTAAYSEHLTHYVDNLDDANLTPEKQPSESPDTALWVITATTVAAEGDESGWSRYRLGTVKHGQRWFALVRLMTPWLAPRHGRFMHELAKEDAIIYSFLRDDGLHVVFLAVSGVGNVQTVFQRNGSDLMVHSRNDSEREAPLYVVTAVGRSFDFAIAAAIYKARSLVSPYSYSPTSAHAPNPPDEGEGRLHINWVQNWYDGFAYCTWNGLGKALTEDKLLTALDSLKKSGITITNLIIDDNWQSLDKEGQSNMLQGWKDFEANPKGFPQGMKHTIGRVRDKYPELQHIAVWHALLGYWGGISPEGKLSKLYQTRQVKVRRDAIIVDGSMLVIDGEHASKLYDDFYSFLSSCRIDAVKTDAQFALDELTSARDRRELTGAYRSAWTIAHLKHFAGHAISCMSQTPYNLFASQLPNTTPAIPVRNSDDFFPNVDDSHPWHVYCNAYNSLFTKHLNVLPDWDMFQTSHAWASFHAAARCLSGGPIYITDEPGKHNVELIRQMTAQTSRGQTVILRPSVVGRSGNVYVGYDEDALLKIDAYNGAAKTGASFMGLFNCRAWPLCEMHVLSEFMGAETGVEYIVRAYRTGKTSDALEISQRGGFVVLEVEAHSWEILTAHPIALVTLPQAANSVGKPVKVAALGLTDHMSGAAALVSSEVVVTPASTRDISSVQHRIKMSQRVKALGVLGIWLSLEALDKDDMLLVLLEGEAISAEHVTLEAKKGATVILVDIETAWKKMGLKGTFSNELSVQVFVGL